MSSEVLADRLVAEGLISVSAAARLYGSTPAHRSTVTRHALTGVKLADGRRVKLEAVRVGGQLKTTAAAVRRFIAAQNEPDPTPPTPTPPALVTSADRVLDAAGI